MTRKHRRPDSKKPPATRWPGAFLKMAEELNPIINGYFQTNRLLAWTGTASSLQQRQQSDICTVAQIN